MIARQWHGRVLTPKADAYLAEVEADAPTPEPQP